MIGCVGVPLAERSSSSAVSDAVASAVVTIDALSRNPSAVTRSRSTCFRIACAFSYSYGDPSLYEKAHAISQWAHQMVGSFSARRFRPLI